MGPGLGGQGLVGYKRTGADLELKVAPDVPETTRRGRPFVYGCGTVVGRHLEVALFYLEDLPSGITACDYVLPVIFKDVPWPCFG